MFATINKKIVLTANMGVLQTGKTVGYTLLNGDGTTFQARTTTGVTEIQAGTGLYRVEVANTVFTAAFDGYVLWDVAGAAPYATEDIFVSDRLDVAVSTRADGAHYTNARGDKLDNVDVATSSRADGSVWTAALAAVLNALSTRTGTAQAGASGSITLDSGASGVNDFYVGQWVVITSGAGAGQSRLITSYVGSTKVAAVHAAWKTQPSNTSVFYLLAAADINGVVLADTATALTNAPPDSSGTTSILARIGTPAGASVSADVAAVKTDTAAVKADVETTGVVVAAASKTGYALTAGEHTSIAADTQTGLTAQGYTTARAGYLDTLNGLVQAVWDKATSALTTAGSIGKLLATNIDAAISSRLPTSSYVGPDNTDVATILTDVTAIKAKTDLLGTSVVTVASPVTTTGNIQLVTGDDYLAADSRGLSFTSDGTWPSLASATVRLHVGQLTITGTVTGTTVTFDLTAAQTATLDNSQRFAVIATLADTHTATLVRGTCYAAAPTAK